MNSAGGSTQAAIEENLAHIEAEITAACQRAGRPRAEVALMAVSKTHPASAIVAAAAAGVTLFGENRVQEFQQKLAALPPRQESLHFHLIGHLQSNKSARAVEIFSSIDSLDSLRLAVRLNEAAARLNRRLPVKIEIKLMPEAAKTGLDSESRELQELLERLPDLAALELRGLMTVPPYLEDPAAVRPYFTRLRRLRDQMATAHPRLDFRELSMGMSHDFAVAIEEGSTQVRIGTALFGPRSTNA